MDHRTTFRRVFPLPVIAAALGDFVDIYDLVLFSIVRVPSLKALGVSGKELTDYGVDLLNMQMAGPAWLPRSSLWQPRGDVPQGPGLFRGVSVMLRCSGRME